jgi:hypothetical protein
VKRDELPDIRFRRIRMWRVNPPGT